MTKFRQLSSEELKELEKEFIEFLVVNGIDADTWEKLKAEENEKAEFIIDQFSDVVFTSIYRKSEFVDYIAEDQIKCFHFQNEQVVLVGIDSEDKQTNFLKASLEELSSQKFKVYTSDKKYIKSREEEMHAILSSGGKLSDGQLFKKICLAL